MSWCNIIFNSITDVLYCPHNIPVATNFDLRSVILLDDHRVEFLPHLKLSKHLKLCGVAASNVGIIS